MVKTASKDTQEQHSWTTRHLKITSVRAKRDTSAEELAIKDAKHSKAIMNVHKSVEQKTAAARVTASSDFQARLGDWEHCKATLLDVKSSALKTSLRHLTEYARLLHDTEFARLQSTGFHAHDSADNPIAYFADAIKKVVQRTENVRTTL